MRLNFFKKKTNKKRGFTLIELLVVISIIMLLASIATVAMNSSRMQSRDAKRKADIKQIAAALEIYFEDWNQYPFNGSNGYNEYSQTTIKNLFGHQWDSSCFNNDINDPFLTPLSTGSQPYMATLPDDPNSTKQDTCYLYSSTDTNNNYDNAYYLIATIEGANSSNPAEKSCTGLDGYGLFKSNNTLYCLSQSHQ